MDFPGMDIAQTLPLARWRQNSSGGIETVIGAIRNLFSARP
jgi:hypothetical protein